MAILYCDVCKHKVIPDARGLCPQCQKQLEILDSSLNNIDKNIETEETPNRD